MTVEEKRHARRAGLARRSMRPQQHTAIEVLVAAWARGWTREQIAAAAGVSYQRVQQRLEKYEREHGQIERLSRPVNLNTATRAWHCAGCGKLRWSSQERFYDRGSEMFCSLRCQARVRTEISEGMIEGAIDLRWQGKSWSSIAQELGHPIQAIQLRIWKHLYKVEVLTLEMVRSIWRPSDRYSSWDWLERNTGIICTETGALGSPSRIL